MALYIVIILSWIVTDKLCKISNMLFGVWFWLTIVASALYLGENTLGCVWQTTAILAPILQRCDEYISQGANVHMAYWYCLFPEWMAYFNTDIHNDMPLKTLHLFQEYSSFSLYIWECSRMRLNEKYFSTGSAFVYLSLKINLSHWIGYGNYHQLLPGQNNS